MNNRSTVAAESQPVSSLGPTPEGASDVAEARTLISAPLQVQTLVPIYLLAVSLPIFPLASAWGSIWLCVVAAIVGLAGAAFATLIWGNIRAVRLLGERIEANGQVACQIIERLEEIKLALESKHALSSPSAPAEDPKAQRLAEIRHAIRVADWGSAGELVQAFTDTFADDPTASRIAAELGEARDAAAKDVIAKIESARQVNDPERVIELRENLKPLLPAEELRQMDRDLAKWFMTVIHRKLRSGTMPPEVATLAGRVAESLDDTPEGASLRASLPTLRRAAGLCARCAKPYKGISDACPACLAGASVQAVGFSSDDHDPDD